MDTTDLKHPYEVRGRSPRAIVEALLAAYDDFNQNLNEHLDWQSPSEVRIREVDAVLEAMKEMGVGFCDWNDRKR